MGWWAREDSNLRPTDYESTRAATTQVAALLYLAAFLDEKRLIST
jgi:hypothetical protein